MPAKFGYLMPSRSPCRPCQLTECTAHAGIQNYFDAPPQSHTRANKALHCGHTELRKCVPM
jgi:hypothetical protein